jgi:hypothetical protein
MNAPKYIKSIYRLKENDFIINDRKYVKKRHSLHLDVDIYFVYVS